MRMTVDDAYRILAAAEDELGDVEHAALASRVVHLPLSWDDPSTREAIARYMHGVRADAPWCPWNIEFIRRINGLPDVDDVHRIVHDASYLVLGLGDVYLGAPVATPLDPRHRLVTTKYNPARTWTPENAVGIGGAYLCIYGMEGPGGYQFVGRTVQVWNQHRRGPHFDQPWLLRPFDQLRFHPVSAEELLDQRADQAAGRLAIAVEHETFRLADHRAFLAGQAAEIEAFRAGQQARLRRRASPVELERRVVRSARQAVDAALAAVDADARSGIWITLVDGADARWAAAAIDDGRDRGTNLPLAGLSLAVKDNIDVAGLPTTAACPAFAYAPTVERPRRGRADRRRRHRDRQDQPRPVRHRPRRGPVAVRHHAERPLAGSRQRRFQQRLRRGRGEPAWWTSHSAPIRPGPVACRRRATASSASSRRAAGSAPAASCRRAVPSTACRCSPGTSGRPRSPRHWRRDPTPTIRGVAGHRCPCPRRTGCVSACPTWRH